MKSLKFKKLVSDLDSLTYKQKMELLRIIESSNKTDQLLGTLINSRECRHCKSQSYYKWGKESGIQRYKCRTCKKTYNQLTNTPLAKLRKKEQWITNASEMIKGSTLKDTAEICNTAISTSFRWRHRFLELLSQSEPESLTGIIEADETYFLESHKGERGLKSPRKRGGKAKKRGLSSEQIPVLIARDRNGQTLSRQLSAVNSQTLSEALKPVIENGSVLCTDGHAAYPNVSKDCGALHKRLNIKSGIKVLEKVYHIQNVNAYDSRLKSWIKRFHGVLTKYLQRYLGWWRAVDTLKNLTPEDFLQRAISVKNNFTRVMLI